jgi:MFS family permease
VPLSQSILLDINPPSRQGQAMAVWGMGVMVGPILGPTLGGWLTDSYNWRWVSSSTCRSAHLPCSACSPRCPTAHPRAACGSTRSASPR